MSLFKNLFGKSDPVAELGKLHTRREWASLLLAAKRLDRGALPAATQAQIAEWEAEAGDRLAEINLAEGEGALRLGNRLKALEHLRLAVEQARTPALGERAHALLAGTEGSAPPVATAAVASCASGCTTTCAPPALREDEQEIDAAGHLELLLATLPTELAARYTAAGDAFLRAWLAAQEGDDQLALALFEQVPTAQRGVLFRAERGVVLARNGATAEAEADLRAALEQLPELFHPFDALVTLLAVTDRHRELEQLLKQALAARQFAGYCWSRLAQLEAGRGNNTEAVAACNLALAEGEIDPATVVMCAGLQEQAGRHAEAEKLLCHLPSGGCGGGAHPLMAEFWLRHGQNLDRALESFKGAMRHELDNPRWLLRVAQVYIAKGWKKDAVAPIESLLAHDNLPEELRAEVQAAATALKAG